MNINLNSLSALTGAAATGGTTTAPPTTPTDPLASENVFLKLFIAQLENQDPSTPSDPTQFVTQLAQFTTLEQSTQQTSDLNAILAQLQSTAPAGTGSGSVAQTGLNTPVSSKFIS
jgi:flagellar basal-body rod modification protein FlgD